MSQRAPYRYLFVPMNGGPSHQYNHIGDLIKMYREQHNLTQYEFAALCRCWIVNQFPNDPNILNKISMTQKAISWYEQKRCCPKIDRLTVISKVMGYDVSVSGYEFLTGYSKVAKSDEGFDFIVPHTRKTVAKQTVLPLVASALANRTMLSKHPDPYAYN